MPRIAYRLLRTARAIHPDLARLLPVCKDLRSARNELRWIRERVQSTPSRRIVVAHLVRRRARGEPLQYVLGDEFFGNLEVKCKPGVLIPRSETAASVTTLVRFLAAQLKPQSLFKLRVLDMCTGTGCIPLLFHDEFYKHSHLKDVHLDIEGFDISSRAINLASENLALQLRRPENQADRDISASQRHESLRQMKFSLYDVLAPCPVAKRSKQHGETGGQLQYDLRALDASPSFHGQNSIAHCDILISNPPYISPSDYTRATARSVRQFEPKLALVPPSSSYDKQTSSTSPEDRGDAFYPKLLDLAERTSAKLVLLEVADIEQAARVLKMVFQRSSWSVGVEIWRDEPSRTRTEEIVVDGRPVKLVGEGNGRSVFIWRTDDDLPSSAADIATKDRHDWTV